MALKGDLIFSPITDIELSEKMGIDDLETEISGKSTVTYTPTVTSGTELGKIKIDGTTKKIYAPAGGASVSVTQTVTSGTELATITVDSVDTKIYAPDTSEEINYDNTASGLSAANVQNAIDELADEKIDTFSGTVSGEGSITYTSVTCDGIGYDSTNNQLLLKVNGADTVIPFSKSSDLEDFSSGVGVCGTMSDAAYITYFINSSDNYYGTVIPVQGYSKIKFLSAYNGNGVTFAVKLKDGTCPGGAMTVTAPYEYVLPANAKTLAFVNSTSDLVYGNVRYELYV